MTDTPKLGITEMEQSQSQKHVTFNEAMFTLDALVQGSVKDRDLSTPPGAPVEGDRYIVGASPTGDWTGAENSIAAYQGGAWVLRAPFGGWRVWIDDEGGMVIYDGSAWINLVGAAGNGSAAAPSYSFASDPDMGMYRNAADELGFSTGGIERAKISNTQFSISTGDLLANNAGSDSTLTLNKNSATDDASLQFQNGFTSTALMGALGSDDFIIKVGASLIQALKIDASTGVSEFKELSVKNDGGSDVSILLDGSNTTSGLSWTIEQNRTSGRMTLVSSNGNKPFKFDHQAQNNLFRVGNTSTDIVETNGRFKLGIYTVASLPSASDAACVIYVSDEAGGATIAFSDGTNWRRVTDLAIVS